MRKFTAIIRGGFAGLLLAFIVSNMVAILGIFSLFMTATLLLSGVLACHLLEIRTTLFRYAITAISAFVCFNLLSVLNFAPGLLFAGGILIYISSSNILQRRESRTYADLGLIFGIIGFLSGTLLF